MVAAAAVVAVDDARHLHGRTAGHAGCRCVAAPARAAAGSAVAAGHDIRSRAAAAAAAAAGNFNQRMLVVAVKRERGVFANANRTCGRGVGRGNAAAADGDEVCRVRRDAVRLAVEDAAAAAAAADLVAARAAAAHDDDLNVRHVVGRRERVFSAAVHADEPVVEAHQLAVRSRFVDVAVRAERPRVLERLPPLAGDLVDRADAEVVGHVLLEPEHGNRELRPRRGVVKQVGPVVLVRRLLAVRPELVLDPARVRARAAERHRTGELHVGVAHVNDRSRHAFARLPDDHRDGRFVSLADRALCHEPFFRVVPPCRLHRRVVFGLDPVRRAHPLGIAALVHPAVKRAGADLLSADDQAVVIGGLVVRNLMDIVRLNTF